ncbi:MAG: hypothetical protein WC356_01475 [Candidatus Micrarchaeia archaeon]|jgi:hypothetical protein
MGNNGQQIITITFDQNWRFICAWTDDLGRRIAKFEDGSGDEIVFEVVDSQAAEAFLEAARAVQ